MCILVDRSRKLNNGEAKGTIMMKTLGGLFGFLAQIILAIASFFLPIYAVGQAAQGKADVKAPQAPMEEVQQ